MIICNKCGTPNEDNQVHCLNCHFQFPQRPHLKNTAQVIQSNVRQIPNSGISYPDNDSVIAEAYPENESGLEDLIEKNFQQQRHHQVDSATEAPVYATAPTPNQASNASVAPDSGAAAGSSKLIWIAAVVALLLISGVSLFMFMSSDQPLIPNSSLFAEAENLYHAGNFAVAITKYQEFVEKHPDNALVELASAKITELNKMQLIMNETTSPAPAAVAAAVTKEPGLSEADQREITSLMKKAKTAYLRKRYLSPAEESAIFFLTQVLTMDPENESAKEMKGNILSFYREKADAAFDDRIYKTAYKYYQNILKISPKDRQALANVNKIPRKYRRL